MGMYVPIYPGNLSKYAVYYLGLIQVWAKNGPDHIRLSIRCLPARLHNKPAQPYNELFSTHISSDIIKMMKICEAIGCPDSSSWAVQPVRQFSYLPGTLDMY